MRDKLARDITSLSTEWRREREERKQAKRKDEQEGQEVTQIVESSDDEIDIVEHAPAVGSEKKGVAKGMKGKGTAVTARGKVLRVRG